MQKKITLLLLAALIVSLGFGQLLRLEWGSYPVYIHDILICLLLSLNIKNVIQTVFHHAGSYKLPLVLIIISMLLASIFQFPQISAISFVYSLRLIVYLFLFLYLRNNNFPLPKKIYILSLLIALTVGFLQYFFMPDMRWAKNLGWDDHLGRLVLPFFDPFFTASFLIVAYLTLVSSNDILLTASIFIAVMLTYSRSSWLAALILGFLKIRKNSVKLLLGLIFLFALILLPRTFGEGTNLLRTFSIEGRILHDMDAIRNLRWKILVGAGYGYSMPSISDKGYTNRALGLNNSYLFSLAAYGLMGLWGWLAFFREFYRSTKYKIVLLFVLIASLFNNLLFYPFVLVWLFLMDLQTETKVPSVV